MPAAPPPQLPGRTASPLLARAFAAARAARLPLLIGLGVLLACLAGIAMRPIGFFSSFWPANALMAGLLVRLRLTRRPAVWVCAFAGYMAADLLNGSSGMLAAWLTGANVAGVAIVTLLLRRLDAPTRQLRRPLSALHLLWICVAAASVAALVGAGSAPLAFKTPWLPSLAMWFSSDLMNYLLILPVVLSAPRRGHLNSVFVTWRPDTPAWKQGGPLLAVLATEALVPALRGASWAIALVVPALLWCAVSYSRFITALLCLAVCLWKTVELAAATALAFQPDHWQMILSLRIGIAMLSLGPLGVASVITARNEALQCLQRQRDAAGARDLHDILTRSAVVRRARQWLAQPQPDAGRRCAALLLLGLDPLPQLAAQHGPAAGNQLLAAFADAVVRTLQPGEALARLGSSEKFVLLLPGASDAAALATAERLCATARSVSATAPDGSPLRVTVSVGAAFYARVEPRADCTPADLIRRMLGDAELLLDKAQAAGRDCVVFRALDRPGSLAEADWTNATSPT